MRRLAILVIFLSLVAAAIAQFGMGQMLSSPFMCMSRPDIRKELKLTKDQNKQVDAIVKDVMASARNQSDPMGGMRKMTEADKQILDLLDDNQKKRLGEIRIQMRGPAAILDEDVSKPLGLSEDQIKQAHDLQSAYMNELLGMMQHPSPSMSKTADKKRDENDAKLMAVLTDAQREQFKAMQGAPFKNARLKGT